MNDFIQEQGVGFFAHLLGRLNEQLVKGFVQWNPEVGILAPPRTHSTMRVLADLGPKSVTEIATILKQSHPLVITWVRCLRDLGFVESEDDPNDRRRTMLSLTQAGNAELERQRKAGAVIEAAIGKLLNEAGPDLFSALWRVEHACASNPFVDRLRHEAARLETAMCEGTAQRIAPAATIVTDAEES